MAAWALYGVGWLSFGVLHSILATPLGRSALGRLAGGRHRLIYNLIALLHFGAVWLMGRLLFDGLSEPFLPLWGQVVGYAVALVGLIGLAWSAKAYDAGLFLGFTASRPDGDAGDAEPLVTGGANALVRHPLYAAALLLVWGPAQDPFGLATAIYATAYILIGIRYEERKLLRRYGDAYRAYKKQVPMLIPRLP